MIENRPVLIAMVDDHILLRDALAKVINKFDNCSVTMLASNGEELIENLKSGHLPDLVILDINMPVLDGYETTKYLRMHYPGIYVLILTMYDAEETLLRLLKAGARGLLKKDIHPGELNLAIQSVMKTGYFYSNNTGKLVNLLKKEQPNIHPSIRLSLTDNELTFLKLASTEKTYKEIAEEMNVSPRTVDNYRESLFIKLGVKSRVGLVIYAFKNGLISVGY